MLPVAMGYEFSGTKHKKYVWEQTKRKIPNLGYEEDMYLECKNRVGDRAATNSREGGEKNTTLWESRRHIGGAMDTSKQR